ncbi:MULTISPECIES: hypothetical protein [unclassified Rahnella]|jgi:hypothetical protein|uniref:hypothetical protein n=1 Tax=unclassified Rahnella TaxID=2635087 RepID=UPI00068B1044|nr:MULTISPECIES: hypothetical protein [unclassified Rahnella]
MTPIVFETTESFLLSQILASFAGLFGGLSLSFFWQPKRLHQHGPVSAGVIISSISVGAAFALGGLVSGWLGMNFNQAVNAMGLGYGLGVVSVGMIAWLANFFNRREDDDILEIAEELQRAAFGFNKKHQHTPLKKPRSRTRMKPDTGDKP